MSLSSSNRLLFIGFAAADEYKYFEIIKCNFSRYGCEFDILSEAECKSNESIENIAPKFAWADIIYVGGGNTYRLMKMLRQYSIA